LQHWSNCAAAAAPDEYAAITDRWDAPCGQERYEEWHDPVTGLPRPQCFLEHLEGLLAKPDRRVDSVAMLLLEVVHFNALSAQVGTPLCDELLRAIGERLHEEVPEPNLVTRLRGGEFAIVLHDLGPEVTPDALAAHLLERASEPVPGADRLLRWAVVGALAATVEGADTAMQLFDRATRALGRAKLRRAGQRRPD
jgi:diguanylate cyclase (GGDEF)-like protein